MKYNMLKRILLFGAMFMFILNITSCFSTENSPTSYISGGSPSSGQTPVPAHTPDKVLPDEYNLDGNVPQELRGFYNTIKNAVVNYSNKVELSSLLNENQRKAVEINGKVSLKQEISDKIDKSFELLLYYNPDLFYTGLTYQTGMSYSVHPNPELDKRITSLTLSFPDMPSKSEIINMQDMLSRKVKNIVYEAKNKSNIFEQELYIHDYLVQNTSYDMSGKYSHTAYGAIVLGKALCEGYSRAFQLLMLELGADTYLIAGESSGPHMWNIIKLGGHYYHVDITHDDPVNAADSSRNIIHVNFNQTDEIMKKTHTWSQGSLPVPGLKCTSSELNYYINKGYIAENAEELAEIVKACKARGYAEIFFPANMISRQGMDSAMLSAGIHSYYHNYNLDDTFKKGILKLTW